MSIFRFAYSPYGVRVLAYIAFPVHLHVDLHEARQILRDSFPEDVVDIEKVIQVASDWVPPYRESADIEGRTKSSSVHSGLDATSSLPALMYCRGGTGRVGPVRVEWMQEFCQQGFVVVAPCYRHAEGGQGFDEFGGRENDDVVALVMALEHMPVVREDAIFIVGFSRGSINAFQTAVACPQVRALVAWGGVSNLADTYEERKDLRRMLRRKVGGTPQEVPSEYERRSPVSLAPFVRCPVLIVHGTKDVQVDFSHATNLLQALQNENLPVSKHFYEGLGHHVPGEVHEGVIERMSDFLLALVDET